MLCADLSRGLTCPDLVFEFQGVPLSLEKIASMGAQVSCDIS